MENQTVFVKRYPSKGELPIIQGKEYLTDRGKMYDYVIHPNWDNIEYWLEEIELPSEEEVNLSHGLTYQKHIVDYNNGYIEGYEDGADFILNKLKGENK